MNAPHYVTNTAPGSRAYCTHCHNAGLVILDSATNMEGAPCPMCAKGYAAARATFDNPTWWRDVPDSVTWERGLTVRHIRRCQAHTPGAEYPCGQPATGQLCDYHAEHAPRPARRLNAPRVGVL